MLLKTLETWFLWVMIYSIIGWIYESTICSVSQRRFVNRGFLNGPYCPIYGNGALLVILILGRIHNPVLLFLLGALVTCSLEYLTSYLMEKLFHARWWDYSKRKCNLNGRVCLLGAVVFGTFSVALVLGLHPLVVSLTDRLTGMTRHIVSLALLAAMIADYIVTLTGMAGFRTRLEEIADYLEQQKEESKLRASEAYLKRRAELKRRLSLQQRRLIAAFPTLKMKKPKHDETLQKLREALRKAKERR